MKRAITGMLLAALVGATGCGSGYCDNLQLAWSFTDANGNPISCESSGTSAILVFLDDQQLVDAAGYPLQLTCADGPIIPVMGVGPNPVKIQLDAYDANQNILYQFIANNVTTRQCGNSVLPVDLSNVHGALAVALTGLQLGCPYPGYVWYTLTDLTTNQQYVVDGTSQFATSIDCQVAPTTVTLFDSLPFGPYRLDWIEIVTKDAGNHLVLDAENCTPQQFDHRGDDLLTIPMTQPATTGCQ
jgi:hypothetical protein